MARQLVQFRTPAAYTGVENYAHTHAGTEAGALAWFAIGYAHYLDAQYPAAIAALQKAAAADRRAEGLHRLLHRQLVCAEQ